MVESKKPMIVLSFHDCELHCCHLDGFQSNTNGLLKRLEQIETIFRSKPAHAKYRIWFNMDKSNLNSDTMQLIAESISRIEEHINKIAFVGLCGVSRRRFDAKLQNTLKENILHSYFKDAEAAKEWLV